MGSLLPEFWFGNTQFDIDTRRTPPSVAGWRKISRLNRQTEGDGSNSDSG
jgi:hypothetical protein